MSETATSAVAAAEHYKRAREIYGRAKVELIAASNRERDSLNIKGLAHRAGIDESTLWRWMAEERSNGGGIPATTD